MDEFVKPVVISFKVDKSSYDNIKNLIDSLNGDFKLDGPDEASLNSFREIFNDFKNTVDSGNLDQEAINEEFIDTLSSLMEDKEEIDKETLGDNSKDVKDIVNKLGAGAQSFYRMLLNLSTTILTELEKILSDSWKELNNILNYSQLTDAEVREQALTYGFDAAQNYAFSKTKEFMGISSDEDLYYMNAQQQAEFYKKFEQYTNRYNKLYDKGFFEDLQEFNWEMAEFREDLEYEFITFFLDNKEIIKEGFKMIIDISKAVTFIFGLLLDLFKIRSKRDRTEEERQAAVNEILGITNNSNTVNNNSTTNVNIDNSFTNVAKEDQTWLANAGEMTYEQIVRALSSTRR